MKTCSETDSLTSSERAKRDVVFNDQRKKVRELGIKAFGIRPGCICVEANWVLKYTQTALIRNLDLEL